MHISIFTVIILLIVITSFFGYINVRFIKLPETIGLMVISVLFSLLLIVAGMINPGITDYAATVIGKIDFSKALFNVMLSFLLFAGALHTDAALLKKHWRSIGIFAVIGVIISTALVGTLVFFFFKLINSPVSYAYCLLFGALISPTDPIAVLGILTKAKVPKDVEINIVGESLFNDGIGVVLFLSIMEISNIGISNISFSKIAWLLSKEVFGGIIFGLVLGYIAYRMMKSIDNYQTEIMITLAMVMGGYYAAQLMHISGPLAMVVAGLFTGSRAKSHAMSSITGMYIDKFWELMDVLMNALLFVLVGLEIIVLDFSWDYLLAGAIAILVVLISRYIALRLPLLVTGKLIDISRKAIGLMTWGGLRGGLSIAMALSLQGHVYKDRFVFMTYMVVLFSILVQGLSVSRLAKRMYASDLSAKNN